MSKYRETPEEITTLPRGIKYIIGNEAAERFSFYGMKTILVVFMTRYLHLMTDGEVGAVMSGAEANERYHDFVSWTYFFPVLGSLLSDVFVGKYRTILWLSIVYCLGHLSLALMGTAGLTGSQWLLLGLFLIAFGSGGIKPCVSAHVGDQFGKKNSRLMTKVYQWFYFSINFGSTASTIMTPWLLLWYGPHWAFGIPGVLMAIATLLFWKGRNVFIHVPPGGTKFFKETFSREGVFALLKLTIVYAFVAVFWSLFDQTGSSWVLQAENMDRRFLGVEWLESQIQVVNPILVMVLIPIFQFVVYPVVDRFFTLTAIRKIGIGLFISAAAFGLLTIAQQKIDQGQTPSIAWQLWAYLLLTAAEVMISITGLEFSYTQAPKAMKSVVMAVWLFAVSAGNFFTSSVNHSIQTPSVTQINSTVAKHEDIDQVETGHWKFSVIQTQSAEDSQMRKTVRVFGHDAQPNTADDVVLEYDDFNNVMSIVTPEDTALNSAAQKIEEAFFASAGDDDSRRLPVTEQGQELLAGLNDSNGEPLVYRQLSKDTYRISSKGADRTELTQWDVILIGKVNRAMGANDPTDQPLTWRQKRIIEVKGEEGRTEVERERGEIAKTEISTAISVGGQDKMEGASYFRFWTYVVLVTAVLYVPVAVFYKEKSYIQTESE
ncbi:MAG: POT family MFS transporter [Planctomycetales bacterium]|nr:POT family MFS transporter [Planctomycetales bacterium]